MNKILPKEESTCHDKSQTGKKPTFAVIYRFALLPGKEIYYQELWHEVSNYFVKSKGALGSTLHKTNDGYWLAYSRWPNRESRDDAWPVDSAPNSTLPEAIRSAIIKMKACAQDKNTWPPIEMEIVQQS
jgi:hypothetical protein